MLRQSLLRHEAGWKRELTAAARFRKATLIWTVARWPRSVPLHFIRAILNRQGKPMAPIENEASGSFSIGSSYE